MKPSQAMQQWTDGIWMRWTGVQALHRGYEYNANGKRQKITKNNVTPETISMQQGMKRYFRHTKLRAPMVPPGETISGFLFRAIRMTPKQYETLLQRKVWTDKGYMAFATQSQTALDVLSLKDPTKPKNVVFIVSRKFGIPNGTPWAWYGRPVMPGGYLPKNKIRSLHGPSNEVLLPPGIVFVQGIAIDRGVTFMRIKYFVKLF